MYIDLYYFTLVYHDTSSRIPKSSGFVRRARLTRLGRVYRVALLG